MSLERTDLIAQRRGGAQLFEVSAAMLLILRPELVELGGEPGETAFLFGRAPRDFELLAFGRLKQRAGFAPLLLQVTRADTHRNELPAVSRDLLLQVALAAAFLFDGRFLGGNAFAV